MGYKAEEFMYKNFQTKMSKKQADYYRAYAKAHKMTIKDFIVDALNEYTKKHK